MSRPPGRPRSFDPHQTLRTLAETFRDRGFSGASLDDLSASAGLNRPSLYSAYGDKRSMYLKALTLVHQDLIDAAERLDAAELHPRDALECWFAGVTKVYLSGDRGAGGCLAICTATAEAVADHEVRESLDAILRWIDERLMLLFTALGDPRPELKAGMASALMHSLAVRARAGYSATELERYWRSTLEFLVADASAPATGSGTAEQHQRRPRAALRGRR